MIILHTADLHLDEEHEERWSAFDELVSSAREHEVDALIISGDLFDHGLEAEKLRNRLRSTIGSGSFRTVILPGNHDYKAYRSGLYFGENVSVINNWEDPVEVGEVVIWGLPYESLSAEKIVRRLKDLGMRMDPDRINYLLFHGELLDAYFSPEDMGDEGDQRFLPVKLSYFADLPIKHVLAGHFHSRYAAWNLPGGGLFVYPGSPSAVTRREIGIRKANLVEHGGIISELILNTAHYERLSLNLDPFSERNPLEQLEQFLQGLHLRAKLILSISGYFNGAALGLNESELVDAIKLKMDNYLVDELVIEFKDVQHILEDDLFKKFREKLSLTDYTRDQQEKAEKMLIDAFRGVKR
ncbi:MAG: metallophosphoesterase family protein [Bacillota bacterium]